MIFKIGKAMFGLLVSTIRKKTLVESVNSIFEGVGSPGG